MGRDKNTLEKSSLTDLLEHESGYTTTRLRSLVDSCVVRKLTIEDSATCSQVESSVEVTMKQLVNELYTRIAQVI